MLVDKKGTPEILFHGTQDNINEFNADHPNKKDVGAFGKGIYMVRGKDAQSLATSYEEQRNGDTEKIYAIVRSIRKSILRNDKRKDRFKTWR